MHVNYRRDTRRSASRHQRPYWYDGWKKELKKHGARRIRSIERNTLNLIRAGLDPDDAYWPHDKKDRDNPWNWD